MNGGTWRLPGYVLTERIGGGSTSEVWRASARASGESVAVKLLPAVDRAGLDAVLSEAAMLTALDHPHLLRLRKALPCAGGVALVLDLATGGSLADLLATRGRLAPGEVVTALAPIGAALAYAHQAGVVHGDVSPANVLFTRIGFPLLADLGVARLVGDDAPANSTPAYVDPAVAAGGLPAASSDVFMLGAAALHALTGQPPWPGSTADQALAAACGGEIRDVPALLAGAGVPAEMADVVGRALDLDADHRPTAAEFALDLRHCAVPVAVELRAGRSGATGAGTAGAEAADVAGGGVSPAGRAPTPGPAFTHLVRPRPLREPSGRAARGRCSPRTFGVLAAVAVLALALAAVVLLWSPGDHPGARRRAAAMSSAAPSAARIAQVLAKLDARRADAFAQRSPRLLAGVYAGDTLRQQDTELISKIVPADCGLHGAHTTYTDVKITARSADRLVVLARATLKPSVLKCADGRHARASGAGPTTLRITLLRVRNAYLIESITQ